MSTSITQHQVAELGAWRYESLTCTSVYLSDNVLTTSWLLLLQYPLCMSLLADKLVDLKPLITHRLGFSEQEVAKGFDIAARSAETKAIKVMFNL